VIQEAGGAGQVQPRTKRAALLGVVLGLILGLAFAYLVETFDTRVRSTDEIGKYLGGLAFLGRLPAPNKRLQSERRLVMMSESSGPQAEPFRIFRTNLEFVMLDHEIRTIMVTSAVPGEGKSTTIANLAVAFARSGKRVALVDLDLHRPSLDKFFQLYGRPGVTQVALGRVTMEKALVRIAIPGILGGEFNGHRSGSLDVLPAGLSPPDRGAFFDTPALSRILESLREQADLVLIDAPPALEVGDAIALSRKVDGVFVVARLDLVRRPRLRELQGLLAMTSAQTLGFIATDASKEDGYGYGYGYGYSDRTSGSSDDVPALAEAGVGDAA
jgi:polysaccharide biosynthesis transport protein